MGPWYSLSTGGRAIRTELLELKPTPAAEERLALLRYPAIRQCGAALAAGALARLERDADAWLSRALRRERRLGSRPRQLVGDALGEILRRKRLLELLLQRGGWRGDRPAEALLEAALIRRIGLAPSDAARAFGAPVFGAFADPGGALASWRRERAPDEATLLAVAASLTDWFAERLLAERGGQAWALAAALGRRAPVVLRVRWGALGAVTEALERAGYRARPGRWSPTALVVEGRPDLASLPAWCRDRVELQDEGSQLIAELVKPPRGGLVVDFCAGAGGKSLALADRLPRGAALHATDVRGGALQEARRRARRAGVRLKTTRIAPEGPLPFPPASAARVLVDAPCSGSGVLRRHPGSRWRLERERVRELTRLQGAILERAAGLVRPGGRLIYATCSLLHDENQGVADAFLERHPGWIVIPPGEVLGGARAAPLTRGADLSLSPADHETDGFYARIFQRERSAAP